MTEMISHKIDLDMIRGLLDDLNEVESKILEIIDVALDQLNVSQLITRDDHMSQ